MSSTKEERRVTLDPTNGVIDQDKFTDIDLEDGSMEAYSQNVGGKLWFTDCSIGLTSEEVEVSLGINGKNEVPVHTIPTYLLFLKQFMGFMPFLIEIAAIVSIALQDYVDFAIIVAMLVINGLLGFHEEYHAKKSLEELSNSIKSEVTVIRDGNPVVLRISEIAQGDIVLLVGGTVVPADIKWIRGDVMSLDTAALTGEPIPRKYPGEHGDVMLAGTTIKAGECYGQVMAVGTKTEMGQAQADVLKDKSMMVISLFQQKIMLVVKCTISFSLVLVVAALLVQGIARGQFANGHAKDAILSALSILIAAIPIALPLVIQVNMALGASFLAKKHHAIVTSLPALQDIASMSILCSGKTGTLTTANMSIIPESTYAVEGVLPEEVLLYAYLSANADKKDDPIDRAIVTAFGQSKKAKALLEGGQYKQEAIAGFNPQVKRVVAFVKHHNGETMTIAKGLVAKVLNTRAGGEDDGEIQWDVDQINDSKFIQEVEEKDCALSKAGYKTIGISICTSDARRISKDEPQAFRFVGLLPMLDPPRHDTAATINSLHHANISAKMITGDHVNIGRETARLIGLDSNILPGTDIRGASNQNIKNELIWEADGFAAVLPSDKRDVVMTLKDEYKVVVGMTGDGVNDAPALSAAQVGIAVEGSTDAAKNAADLILTEPGLSPIYGAVVEARRIFARIKSYVVYRIAASLTLVMAFSIAIYVSGCAVNPLFVIVLALFNDVSMIPVAYDRADATARPQLPKAGKLVALSSYFAICQTVLALIMFYEVGEKTLDGFELAPTSTGTCNGETQGFIWLYLLIATELMIFSARSSSFFWTSLPSLSLVGSVLTTCALGIVVARFAPSLGTSNKNIGWIVLANGIVFFLVDLGKVGFRNMIGDGSAEIIEGDVLIENAKEDVAETQLPAETEAAKQLKKQMRYQVHMESAMPKASQRRSVVVENNLSFADKMLSVGGVSFTDGFVRHPVASGIAMF